VLFSDVFDVFYHFTVLDRNGIEHHQIKVVFGDGDACSRQGTLFEDVCLLKPFKDD
jgi:glycosylphosphatidylinositol transamidase (GPIT) subunit GPI8